VVAVAILEGGLGVVTDKNREVEGRGNADVGAQTLERALSREPGKLVPPAVMEQYKAKLADLGNLGSRQATMTTYYVSIVSALLGVLAFKERALAAVDPVVVFLVGAGGLLVSVLWMSGVVFFRKLFKAKLSVIQAIELELPYRTFSAEFELRGRRTWLTTEQWVPTVFAGLFILLLVMRFWDDVVPWLRLHLA
jgi:hypothetical protein